MAEDALCFAENVLPIIERIRASGITSMRGIAAVLDARGVRTARGGKWKAMQVGAVIRRVETQSSSNMP